ncbi:hypothetical protein [Paracoccus salsus]|uniref:hypothetical protein n=1 Tax=Paracoccus salsus TaxID=2911061 RepID=UPI001F209629|nr:hypothetical protein [Paracoccus salsus]MCF3974989.1 hypothetical protein [Paracoccus salsus]
MFKKTSRIALLSSVAAVAFSTAHAQTNDQADGTLDTQACVTLAERLTNESGIEADVRTQVEDVIAAGDANQCRVVFTAWDEEGTINRESLELVATDTATQRMIVQQEIEVDADVAVYQPPAEVDVDTGTPEVVWTMPRQSVTIDEKAPQIVIRQARPTVNVEIPQPRVTVMIPEPEIVITWPESTLEMSEVRPTIEVRIPEPVVNVNMPDPVVELTIGGEGPTDLVELEDGRFAPQGATEEDLAPRITVQQGEATVSAGQDTEMPEIVFNRGEAVVSYEVEEPEVTVTAIGEPEIRVSGGDTGEAAVTVRGAADEEEDRTDPEQVSDQNPEQDADQGGN